MKNSTQQSRASILSNYITEGYAKSQIKINALGQPYVQHTQGRIMLSLKHSFDSFHNGQQKQFKRIF